MSKIVGAGSLIADITAYAKHFPVDGESTLGTSIGFGPGGKGNNQMTAAFKAGADVRIIAKVGDDFLSGVLLDHYKNTGMSTKYIEIVKGGQTAGALIEVNEETAQNRIIVVKAINETVTREDVLKAEPDFADCDAVLTQLETSMESILCCKELAKKYNKPFILNTAPFQPIPDELICGTDYVTPNETEAEFFTGVHIETQEDAEKAAEKLIRMGAKNVIITLGKNGAFYSNGTEKIMVPSIKVQAVDPTGAGDAFNGGFATAIASGADVKTALRFANCVGALSVTKKGAAPAMPSKDEIYALYEKEYGEKVQF